MRLAAIITISLVSILVVTVGLLRLNKQTKSFKNTDEFVQYLASEAVSDAEKNNRLHLDYSIASIKSVESILSQVHEQNSKDPKSVNAVAMANMYGAYIGETIRRNEPNARWQSGDTVAGEKSYPLIWSAGHSYPMAWCYHRILNGEEDNVWVKYSVLRTRNTSPEPNARPPISE